MCVCMCVFVHTHAHILCVDAKSTFALLQMYRLWASLLQLVAIGIKVSEFYTHCSTSYLTEHILHSRTQGFHNLPVVTMADNPRRRLYESDLQLNTFRSEIVLILTRKICVQLNVRVRSSVHSSFSYVDVIVSILCEFDLYLGSSGHEKS